ncbi:thioesterase II family protein [Rheinheimera sp. SA_1]|uniref:thioesterase II family protein n=1 Tax=Rheinheimera sp. SA_1 TaxID=1827365 RepID=UPI000A5ABB63|nr:alpha/beta fold hydrolase [Rheinheimera sp. SA_1]
MNYFVRWQQREHATKRIFCFPFAGGGAGFYRHWAQCLPADIELIAVQLPGRENLLDQPPMTSLTAIVDTLFDSIEPYLDKPFVFFGHSLGALLAYELARMLRSKLDLSPQSLIVSAKRGPHLPGQGVVTHALSDQDFIDELALLNGTPVEFLQDQELMQFLLPQLRADFLVNETYAYLPGSPLRCPIVAMGGIRDPMVTVEELRGWQQHTSQSFSCQLFDGDHFYLQQDKHFMSVLCRHL